MKVFVTGHTTGLGKALYDKFVEKDYNVLGFSRTNGYNLEKDYPLIIDQVSLGDIFINNAYANGIQKKFLEGLHNHVSKMIVCGSIASYYEDRNLPEYSKQKEELKELYFQKAIQKSKTSYLLLDLTSTSYQKADLIVDSVFFWLEHTDITRISYNINKEEQ